MGGMETIVEWRGRANRLWTGIALFAAIVFAAAIAVGLRIESAGLASLGAAALIKAGVAWAYQTHRDAPRLAMVAEAALMIVALLALGVVFTYATGSIGLPLRDAELAAFDRAIGFDWLAYARAIDASPLAALILKLAYLTLIFQLYAATLVLAARGDCARLEQFLIATGIALFMTGIGFIFFPAVSVYAHLGVDPEGFRHIAPVSIAQHIAPLEGLRSGEHRVFSFAEMAGLVTFPSFHTAGAILAAWAVLRIPVLRVLGVALNVAMLASIPIDGAHYLADVLGGTALAIASIWVAGRIAARRPVRRTAVHPEPVLAA